jgi:tetratricopeptide (TPR) repeat protein
MIEAARRRTDRRLDGWKAVADYLGRSSRTVQRWHLEHGLPVRRIGSDLGSIFAYPDELDGWLRERNPMKNGSSQPTRPVLVPKLNITTMPVPSQASSALPADGCVGNRRSLDLVAQGYALWRHASPSNLGIISRIFREAIDLDPFNSSAFAGLAMVLIVQGGLGSVSPSLAFPSAAEALQRAEEINPHQPHSKLARAWLKMLQERDWYGAQLAFDEALTLPDGCGEAQVGLALLNIAEGDLAEASDLLLEAARQNPLSALTLPFLCWCTYLAGDYSESLALNLEARACGHSGVMLDVLEGLATLQQMNFEKSIPRLEHLSSESPHNHDLKGVLGYAYGASGRIPKAHKILDELFEIRNLVRKNCAFAVGLVFIGVGDMQSAAKWLEESYREGSLWSLGFLHDPIVGTLHDDARSRLVMSRMSYPVADRRKSAERRTGSA